jgi:circadian clock protein KaiB
MKQTAVQTMSEVLAQASASHDNDKFVLRLYVTGITARSQRAILNINTICKQHLQGRYDLEVVDLNQNPALAKDEQIIAATTLLRLLPLPLRRIVGDLSDREGVLVGLDLKRKTDGTRVTPESPVKNQV